MQATGVPAEQVAAAVTLAPTRAWPHALTLLAAALMLLALAAVAWLWWKVVVASAPTSAAQQQARLLVASHTPVEKDDAMRRATPSTGISPVEARDRRVLEDRLHPPVDRADSATHAGLREAVVQRGALYASPGVAGSRAHSDSYRLIGYLTYAGDASPNLSTSQRAPGATQDRHPYPQDSGRNSWQVFARQSGSNAASFYMTPTDTTLSVKVPLDGSVLAPGQPRLKSVEDVPETLQFASPLLNRGTYQFVPLPKMDLTDAGAKQYM